MFRTIDMQYSKVDREMEGHTSCIVCNKAITKGAYATIHVVDGGGKVLHKDDEAAYEQEGDMSGDLGLQPIGADCAKRFPKEYVR